MSHGAQGEVGQGKTSQGSLAIVLGDVAQPVSVQSESVRVDVKATLQSEALSSIHNIAIVNHWAGQWGGRFLDSTGLNVQGKDQLRTEDIRSQIAVLKPHDPLFTSRIRTCICFSLSLPRHDSWS